MLNGLDLCAGSGIGSAAFEAIGFCRTVCYVERDAYCQRLLRQRMLDGWLSPAPIWDDLTTFDGRPWRGCVDFVFGGIPCQPHSLAGKRAGGSDERDLWLDFWRIVREVGPSVVLLENVPGLLSSDRGRMFGRILGDLASGGYDAEWDCIPAAAVGAPHRRDRVWVVAYATGRGQRADGGSQGQAGHADECRETLADAERGGRDGWPGQLRETGRVEPTDGGSRSADTVGARLAQRQGIADDAGPQQQAAERGGDGAGPAGWWESEPGLRGLAYGLAARLG